MDRGNGGIGELKKEEKVIPLQKDFVRDVKKLEYALADQMRRASKSICANLAEGFIKQSYSKPEFKRYITVALGSANEMQLWLSYAFDLAYIENKQFQHWMQAYDAVIGMLINLRNKIK